jgi:hypothetical protein
MNFYQEKLNQIRIALGVAVKMADAMLEDGVTKVEAEAFEPGMKIFVVSETGEKAPAPEGTHTTEDGTKVTVDATGTITAVEKAEPKVEVEIEAGNKGKFSSDELADGTKIETDGSGKFAVGEQLYFITESGEKVTAPAGEHTTKSGITIVTDGEGKITGVKYPDEDGTGSLQKFEDEMPTDGPAPEGDVAMESIVEEKVEEAMKKVMMAIEEIAKEVGTVKEEMAAYKSKMEKMSKTPASNKIPTYNGDPAEPTSVMDAKLANLESLRQEFAKKQRFNKK